MNDTDFQTMLNVGCGPHRADPPWINLDCHTGDGVFPDVQVDQLDPVAEWKDQSVDRVYMGHVLEHVHVADIQDFLAGIMRVLKPSGQVLVTGPDVFKAIDLWKGGAVSRADLEATLEGDEGQVGDWPAGSHKWNCHEIRLAGMLSSAGFRAVKAHGIGSGALDSWPVVSRAPWQCAVTARPVAAS